ncbi:GntR family transcriptional regulator [Rhizobium sp. B230/85]|nr:GntR family transcriptional regulator [Rhizobium sp. L58/93]MBO9136879.1 GntR family transcriptional regulator [Rhizobium sp. B209b/85]MBO9171672.1 GntR family transcriptional regulator [Rhizobium sp. L245/93]MBO9186582.1 GntR family transcriptional regulator [Rhizobium sp. E27B/91]QXZ87446.1 GntR family transcriptional regulator [Rhizobium sp. K1/93]QXZ93535.1 GntR family transcriptional regulator [Rhizobium sp. K15/93]QXZ99129.1 GntR family transcriptional regulator [Rhizobium sp. B230/8
MTLAEQVYQRLTAAILDGELAAGSKISEPALARAYGVSRGPLREALHRLQERKLITRSANQGPRVIKPSAQALLELFVVREALEGMAARMAALNATEAEIVALRAAVAGPTSVSDGAMETTDGAYEQLDRDFHVAVANCSRNPMLIGLLCGELYPLLKLYRGTPVGHKPLRLRAIDEHRRVVDAIADRDAELAEILMRRHILAARSRRTEALKEG